MYESATVQDNQVDVHNELLTTSPILFPNGTNRLITIKLLDEDISQDEEIASFDYDLDQTHRDPITPIHNFQTNQQGVVCTILTRWYE